MSQNRKLMPNLDKQGTKLLNLTVLQRIDPFVEEILMTAAHVTLYEFNIDLSQWGRKDVEGSLFVVKRNAQPRFQFVVMNRRSTDNLVEDLLGDFEYEVQVPYLLYRNAAQEVNGIWFYNAHECDDIANLFSRILSAYSKVPPKSNLSSSKRESRYDFHNGNEFEELEAVPTMEVMEGPLEPTSSTPSAVSDIADDPSFVNFFNTAATVGADATSVGQFYQSSSPIPSPPSHPTSVPSPSVPCMQIQTPSPPLSASAPVMPLFDSPVNGSGISPTANLVKPSSFFVLPQPFSVLSKPLANSSVALVSSLNPPTSTHGPYGAPLLQPFPPPNPPSSLTPPASQNYCPFISKDKIKGALLALVQDDQFIETLYRVLADSSLS